MLTGIQTYLFRREQAGPLEQNDLGPSPKLRGSGNGRKINKLIATPLPSICFTHKLKSENLKICIPLIIYHINQLNEDL